MEQLALFEEPGIAERIGGNASYIVDCISTSLAERFGFAPKKIYCLKQQKGNSSQQMKKYGRVPLRKSVAVWQKR